jgi:hypothetical protein
MKFVPSGRIGNCGHHGTGLRINIADGRHPGIRDRRIPVISGDPPNQIPLTRAIAKASAKRPSRKA